MRRLVVPALLLAVGASACATAGSTWMAEPLSDGEIDDDVSLHPPDHERRAAALTPGVAHTVIRSGRTAPQYGPHYPVHGGAEELPSLGAESAGRPLGKFRNTYYDFPSERDFKGEPVALKNGKCGTIRDVPRAFHDAVCVQGSGMLSSGTVVSFARRDCECAEICPRTQQRICFDALEPAQYPWGRGATGHAITPLLTIAVDTEIIPMQTAVYIPEFDGLPRDPASKTFHDGCFVAQDRGLRVKGRHVDVFTGSEAVTRLWNRLVPSNQGVTVIVDHPSCARAAP